MINVIGLGYIGLPTAMILSTHGNDVVGTDYNENLINTLNSSKITFKEKGVEVLYDEALKNGIKFSNKYIQTNFYIVCVPTPYDKISKKIDATLVEKAVKNVLDVCEKDSIIVIESTVSPGTIDKKIKPLINKKNIENGYDIKIAHAPERIIPGNMLYELENNSRTIGADSIDVANKIKNVYKTFCKGEIITTSIKVAEMTKVIENTFRAVNIAFANELLKICSQDNIDVYDVIEICNMHPRVNILKPGPGVGGHCISVDPWFLVGDYPQSANLIKQAMLINDSMPEYVLNKAYEIMKENKILDINKVGIYGLSYKEDVDDYRESPTLQLLESQKKHLSPGLKVYDPMVKKDVIDNQFHNLDEFLSKVDFVIVMVNHKELQTEISKFDNKIILDTKKVFSKRNGVYSL